MDGTLEVIRARKFRDASVQALYTEYTSPATLALRERLSEEEAESLWLEAESLLRHGLAQGGRMICYAPKDLEHMHPRRVKAMRLVVEIARPDWVERVRFACWYDNTWDEIRKRSRVPDYAALAIVRNMQERGELPPVCTED